MNSTATRIALRTTLRMLAIAIAIAALIDPVWSSTRAAGRELVAIVAMHGTKPVDRLRAAAGGWNITVRETNGPSLPCAPAEHCVVIADGSIDLDVPLDTPGPVSMIAETPGGEPNIEVRAVMVSSTHASAAGNARVDLVRAGSIESTEIRISDSGAVVGSATHKWGPETSATVDVPWWPIQTGARVLSVEAVPLTNEVSAVDNRIDVGVDVTNARSGVLVFDARPSWNSSFVRRALEDDPRFLVGHRARVAPAVTAGTAGARLDRSILDDISLLIIGGPDALTASDVALIDAFIRVRGGTVVLLPEQRPAGPSAALFPGTWMEHLSPAPERIGPLQATEVLRTSDAPLATVLARSGSAPAILSAPAGNGRVIISGAMDAWRYRDKDANGFDRFWRSLAAEGAAAGAPLSLTFDRPLDARGTRTAFTLRDRRMAPITTAEASAVSRCGDQAATVVRLRPAGTAGTFTGEASAADAGSCTVEATVDGRPISASFAVADHPARGATATLAKLAAAVSSTHGMVANSGDEAALLAALERGRQPSSQVVSTRPMRAPWWMIPFAACLTCEWWLRRRDGLR